MIDEIQETKDKKPGTSRLRRLSAAAGVATLVGVASMMAASPASADTIEGPYCNTYHNWYECISYNWTYGYIEVVANNHYSVAETETLWASVNGTKIATGTVTIPAGAAGFITKVSSASAQECAGIDNVQIVCGTF